MLKNFFATKLILLTLLISILPVYAQANTEQDINFILNAKNPPKGVIFEIVEGKDDALSWALPKVTGYAKQLKEKIPGIKIAIVSHGSEQFGLLNDNKDAMPEVHKTVQTLVSSDVPLHICGTHASWRGKDKNDFPDYVDVVPAGPEKIRDYQRNGYALIVIEN